jgi:hypothetical protein
MGKRGSLFLGVMLFLTLMVLVLPGKVYSVSAIDGFNPNPNSSVFFVAIQTDGKTLVRGFSPASAADQETTSPDSTQTVLSTQVLLTSIQTARSTLCANISETLSIQQS